MERVGYRRQYVYDPVHRLIHAWNALVLTLLLVSGELSRQNEFAASTPDLRYWHAWLGEGLILGLVARLVWGLAGTPYARLARLWRPRAWREAARWGRWFTAPEEFGPHAPASLVYVAVYAVLALLAGTGLAVLAVKYAQGPFAAWLGFHVELKPALLAAHVWVSRLLWGFLLAHLAALVWHERRHGAPLAQGMVSGFQYLKDGQ